MQYYFIYSFYSGLITNYRGVDLSVVSFFKLLFLKKIFQLQLITDLLMCIIEYFVIICFHFTCVKEISIKLFFGGGL